MANRRQAEDLPAELHLVTIVLDRRAIGNAMANALGFSSEFFLSRQFRQDVGLSPMQWRKSQSFHPD